MNTYFTYNGISSKDILSQELFIYTFDNTTDISLLKKEVLRTEKSTKKYNSRSYGNTYSENAQITFSIVKDDKSEFTTDEISTVNTWLFEENDCKLCFYDDNDTLIDGIYYIGQFNNSTGKTTSGIIAMTLTFECDSQFAYQNIDFSITSATSVNKVVNCQSDIKGIDIYPVYTITPNENANITIANTTTSKSITFSCQADTPFIYNTENGYLLDENNNLISFNSKGIFNVNDISWISLVRGNNNLTFTGKFTVDIKAKIPKKVGVPFI